MYDKINVLKECAQMLLDVPLCNDFHNKKDLNLILKWQIFFKLLNTSWSTEQGAKTFSQCKDTQSHSFIKAHLQDGYANLCKHQPEEHLLGHNWRPKQQGDSPTTSADQTPNDPLWHLWSSVLSLHMPPKTLLVQKSAASYCERDRVTEKAACWQRMEIADWLMSHICPSCWGCRCGRFEEGSRSFSSGLRAGRGQCTKRKVIKSWN